jgi:hypothetical protein
MPYRGGAVSQLDTCLATINSMPQLVIDVLNVVNSTC